MIQTDHVIGSYIDVFGNEIDEYELMERYTVCYNGVIFKGDTDGYNTHNYDKWEEAKAIYDAYPDIVIKDNEYGVSFANGEWG